MSEQRTDTDAAVTLSGIDADELGTWLATFGDVFGTPTSEDRAERSRAVLEQDRIVAARDPAGTIVGTSAIYSFRMTLPGRVDVPCAGVTLVAVRADHRRRGVLRRMMHQLLDQAEERGEPVAALWASETPIYGRFGFGPAAPTIDVEVRRDQAVLRLDGPVDEIRLVDAAVAREHFPPLHDAHRLARPGAMTYHDAWWAHRVLAERPELATESGPLRLAWLPDRGYATYRVKVDWSDLGPSGRVQVGELVGLDPAATAALWRFVMDSDLTTTTIATRRPVDDPLLELLVDRGRAKVTESEALQLRLVDVPAALMARRYLADGVHVLELHDPFRPRNAGRWAVVVQDGQAQVERTELPADLELDVTALATVALGGVRSTQLHAAGRISGDPRAAVALDRTMATDVAPWHGGMF
ncbi:MAG: GNAT family N-acetyltransferase [Nitriliruptoraceae bacterium]|nr:GNAT family N-acetyltransferase [Nitriliruptoraceae bacterium]